MKPRALAALTMTIWFGVVIGASAANTQDSDRPVIVTQSPGGPTVPAPQRRTDDILGIRIENNGALITGPLNARRVYIPVDTPRLPRGFTHLWVGADDLCTAELLAKGRDPSTLPDGTLLIADREIVGRRRLRIEQLFVPLPQTFTLAMLNSGRRLQVRNADHRDAPKVLAIFVEPDGARDYFELSLSEDGHRLTLQGHGNRETATRCLG